MTGMFEEQQGSPWGPSGMKESRRRHRWGGKVRQNREGLVDPSKNFDKMGKF